MAEMHFGSCFCGQLRFRVAGPELYACFCHCKSCQKASGSACLPWATFDRSSFELLDGELHEYRSSPGVTRGHCRHCGTTLTYEHQRRAGQIDITLTSFDDPSVFTPRSHIWVEDKVPWVTITDDLPQYLQTAS